METDRKLINSFLKGDEEAFGMLMDRYEKPLYYFIYRMVGNHEDAADICQKTFIKVFEKVRGFLARSSFKTWLYRIATNQSLNHIRSINRHEADELVEDRLPDCSSSGIEGHPDGQYLRSMVAGLPGKQKTVLILRIYQDMGFSEIASVAGISENSAKVNFHHAIKGLRQRMGDRDGL